MVYNKGVDWFKDYALSA